MEAEIIEALCVKRILLAAALGAIIGVFTTKIILYWRDRKG